MRPIVQTFGPTPTPEQTKSTHDDTNASSASPSGCEPKVHVDRLKLMSDPRATTANDIERSSRFYGAVLGVLSAGEPIRNAAPSGYQRLFYRHDGSTFCVSEPINGESATGGNGTTIGFKCDSPEQVHAFHDAAVNAGGVSIEEPPGMRAGAMGQLYLGYVRDPDGNKLCAIYRPT